MGNNLSQCYIVRTNTVTTTTEIKGKPVKIGHVKDEDIKTIDKIASEKDKPKDDPNQTKRFIFKRPFLKPIRERGIYNVRFNDVYFDF